MIINFTVFHADHNISSTQMDFIQKAVSSKGDGFFIQEVEGSKVFWAEHALCK